MGYIYILTSPNGKSYIGQTIRPIEKRFEQHQKKGSQCVAIYNAIQYHGWENFEKDYYECPDEDLNFDEELLVKEMGTLAPGGYNLREGGGNRGKHSEGTKQKMSEVRQGEKHHLYGKNHNGETKQKMRETKLGEKNPMYGKNHTDETKQNFRETKLGEKNPMYGKHLTNEAKQNLREKTLGDKNHNSKKIYQYNLNDDFIQTFGSSGEAARYMGKKDGSKIRLCARVDSKPAYGFKWSHTSP